MDVELLGIADDRPVDRDRLAHNAELDEGAELADHMEALLDCRRVAGRLDIDVATVAVGQLAYLVDDVHLARVQAYVGAAALAQYPAAVVKVDGDQQAWMFQPRAPRSFPGRAARRRRSTTTSPNSMLPRCTAWIEQARGSIKSGMLDRHRRGHFVVQGIAREKHVFGHRAECFLAEAVDLMHLAHPVLASPAEAACPARDDLLGDRHVAEHQPILRRSRLAERDDFADEFMAGDDRRLAVSLAKASPQKSGAPI